MSDALVAAVKARFTAEPHTEKPLWAAWNSALDVIQAHALTMCPRPKSFEVHRMTEVARKALLLAFSEHKPTDDLVRISLAAVALKPTGEA